VASFAEIAIRIPRDLSLPGSDRLHLNSGIVQQIVQTPTEDRVSIAVRNDGGLNVGHGGHAANVRPFQSHGDFGRVRFTPQDGNDD
jgi:hypothetical protein